MLTENVVADYKDVSSGVLLEREGADRLEIDESFFETMECHYVFTYKSPSDLSEEQMQETTDFVQNVEDLILAGGDSYKEYIDIDSLAKQYLLDKIFMEEDAMRISTFYYLDLNADKLYAGPFWDYDRSVGLIYPDYNAPIDAAPNSMSIWYDTFYNDPEFYRAMCETYIGLQSYFERILLEDIDAYAEWVQASVEMDNVLYDHIPNVIKIDRYISWDNYVRYLKFFFGKSVELPE